MLAASTSFAGVGGGGPVHRDIFRTCEAQIGEEKGLKASQAEEMWDAMYNGAPLQIERGASTPGLTINTLDVEFDFPKNVGSELRYKVREIVLDTGANTFPSYSEGEISIKKATNSSYDINITGISDYYKRGVYPDLKIELTSCTQIHNKYDK